MERRCVAQPRNLPAMAVRGQALRSTAISKGIIYLIAQEGSIKELRKNGDSNPRDQIAYSKVILERSDIDDYSGDDPCLGATEKAAKQASLDPHDGLAPKE